MKIYTKTGDQGETGLRGGLRASKDAPRIEAYGAVDELNSVLGVVRAENPPPAIDAILKRIQNELFCLGAELATCDLAKHPTDLVGAKEIALQEQEIDRFEAGLPPLRQFILPAGTRTAALLHLARTVSRRAERLVVALRRIAIEPVRPETVVYLNRLSDLLFVLARRVNLAQGGEEAFWEKPGSGA